MTYIEIVEKIRGGEKVNLSTVTMPQVFMCMHDRVVKNIGINNDIYELIFIPIEEPVGKVIYMDEEHYPTTHDIFNLLQEIFDTIKENNSITMLLEDEFFELKLEVLETKE